MSTSAAFLWRFLDDVWDLLPTEDRQLFEAYWSAQVQIAANLQQRTLEVSLATNVNDVTVFTAERWNKLVMNEETCDLFTKTDSVVLVGEIPSPISKETCFFHTLQVSTPSKQISYQEPIQFFDESVRNLRYGKIVANTISVTIGDMEYTEGRDYTLNAELGTIQGLTEGRLPLDQVATVRYLHSEYKRDLDYEVDETRSTIRRLSGGTVSDGDSVSVYYTYNATATLALEGINGAVSGSTLTDSSKNFGALLPGRTVIIRSGPNTGSYLVNAVLSSTELQIAGSFPVEQVGEVSYSINAFPHGMKIPSIYASIPFIQDRVDDPTLVLVEGQDYELGGGILSCRMSFPLSTLGPEDRHVRQMWAEVTRIDHETPYRNFGVLIDFYRSNSEAYKLALQGLWYTFWTGSTPGNLQRGLHILLGLPYARKAGRVLSASSSSIEIVDARGQVISYQIPSGLVAEVAVDDQVDRFQQLTNGVQIIDRNNEPGFVTNRLGRAGIARFLTSNASKGAGDTDETKALLLLEHHLFMPQVLAEAVTSKINVQELVTFLDNMKPQWTEYVFSFAIEAEEGIGLSEQFDLPPSNFDLTTTVSSNEENTEFLLGRFIVSRNTGEILDTGSQLTGNFRDYSVDFEELGIGKGDVVRLAEGGFLGYHLVLKRISATVLSLDIPDADLAREYDLQYIVLPKELALGHDAVSFRKEHVRRPGSEFLSPSLLTTKTDAVVADLPALDMLALLLVDQANTGFEVQPVTAADPELSELSVASPPPVGVRDHCLASAAVKRTLVSTGAVTHVYAI
jgi:hypothetical protein